MRATLLLLLLAACNARLPNGSPCRTHAQCASRNCKERGHCLSRPGPTIDCTDDDTACADPYAGCKYTFACEAR